MSRRRSKQVQQQSESEFLPKIVVPKTKNQDILLKTIEKNLITFALGAAGTGKTFISIGAAIQHVYNGWVNKIILTRPVVEVGHTIGYLPGNASEKLEPYIAPLFDAIGRFWPKERQSELNVEIVPLNFMRGYTFRDAFVILDEASNCTEEELRMFLTRFGEGSKVVINGDPSQSDLPRDCQGALVKYAEKLKDVELIGVVELGNQDIIRHQIVGKILNALS